MQRYAYGQKLLVTPVIFLGAYTVLCIGNLAQAASKIRGEDWNTGQGSDIFDVALWSLISLLAVFLGYWALRSGEFRTSLVLSSRCLAVSHPRFPTRYVHRDDCRAFNPNGYQLNLHDGSNIDLGNGVFVPVKKAQQDFVATFLHQWWPGLTIDEMRKSLAKDEHGSDIWMIGGGLLGVCGFTLVCILTFLTNSFVFLVILGIALLSGILIALLREHQQKSVYYPLPSESEPEMPGSPDDLKNRSRGAAS